MNTIIEKIRAEVNRQARSIDTATGDFAEGRRMEQRIILSVLSDLEKECEEPINIDFEQELYKHFGQVKDFTLGMQIGKYFYELGKQEKPTPAEGLEEEIDKRYLQTRVLGYQDGVGEILLGREAFGRIARHFARWQREQTEKRWLEDRDGCFWDGVEEGKKAMREQMMNDAVEGVVVSELGAVSLPRCVYEKYDGQKVRIIIIAKED